jgi:hypothetical protein
MNHLHLFLELLDILAVNTECPLNETPLIMWAGQISQTLKLGQDLHKLSVARMELLHLKLLPLVPIATEVAVELELGAGVLQVLLDSLEGLDCLGAAEALYFEALTL